MITGLIEYNNNGKIMSMSTEYPNVNNLEEFIKDRIKEVKKSEYGFEHHLYFKEDKVIGEIVKNERENKFKVKFNSEGVKIEND